MFLLTLKELASHRDGNQAGDKVVQAFKSGIKKSLQDKINLLTEVQLATKTCEK